MKRKVLYMILGAEAFLLCVLCILTDVITPVVSSVMAVPFEQIGLGLRRLSVMGGIGNGIALVLWAGICLLPLIPVFKTWQQKEKRAEHVILGVLSAMLFAALYYMVNPGLLYDWVPTEMAEAVSGSEKELLSVLKASVCMAVWSVVVCYVVFSLLRLFRAGDKEKLFRYLRSMLYALCGLFTGAMVVSGMKVIDGLQTVQKAADGVMSAVKALVTALPYGMDLVVTLFALTLMDELLEDSRSEKVTAAAKKLSAICCLTLAVVTASGVALNIFQILLSREVSDINIHTEIPLMSLTFVLVALLVSRLVEENKQLADDNEMFI